jgi:hypothetical protein
VERPTRQNSVQKHPGSLIEWTTIDGIAVTVITCGKAMADDHSADTQTLPFATSFRALILQTHWDQLVFPLGEEQPLTRAFIGRGGDC